jgi:hypothetical protein
LPLGVVRRKLCNAVADALRLCSQRLTNSKAALEAKYRRLKARLGTSKSIVAMAHHLGSSGRQPSTRWTRSQWQIAWSVPFEPCSPSGGAGQTATARRPRPIRGASRSRRIGTEGGSSPSPRRHRRTRRPAAARVRAPAQRPWSRPIPRPPRRGRIATCTHRHVCSQRSSAGSGERAVRGSLHRRAPSANARPA